MAPKHHPTPLSGGDRKALAKELGKARAMTRIIASQSAEMRAKGEAMIQQADKLLCESWNERMWRGQHHWHVAKSVKPKGPHRVLLAGTGSRRRAQRAPREP